MKRACICICLYVHEETLGAFVRGKEQQFPIEGRSGNWANGAQVQGRPIGINVFILLNHVN